MLSGVWLNPRDRHTPGRDLNRGTWTSAKFISYQNLRLKNLAAVYEKLTKLTSHPKVVDALLLCLEYDVDQQLRHEVILW
jgi:hypothetical protein